VTDLGFNIENVDPDLLLSPEELDQLTDVELQAYLDLLHRDAAEWKLFPKQQRAEDTSHGVDELLYGGAAGGGKTDWMLWHVYHQALKYPGLRVLAMRRTFPQLRESLIERSLNKFDQRLCKYGVAEKRWRFTNGSDIKFGFCDTDEDVRHYLSAEYDIIVFEELTEFTEYQYRMLVSRNRTTVKKRNQGIRPHVIAATNPGQVGHAWVKQHFVDATDYGLRVAEVVQEVNGMSRTRRIAFVPAGAMDNPHMDPDYIFNLNSLPEQQRRQYLYGDWDTFEGQFFTEFDRNVHVVQPFRIPPEWPRVRGIDYGFSAPYCCLWAAFDQDGNCYIYREDYRAGLTATQQARSVVDKSIMLRGDREIAENVDYTVADPSIFNITGTGISIYQMYRDNGLHVKKAMNARIDGWNRVRDYLRADPADPTSGPAIRIFSTCSNLIRTLPLLVFDDHRIEDCDTTGEDHAPDALRYLLMSRPRKAARRADPPKKGVAGQNWRKAVQVQQRGKGSETLGVW
jgi:PBSX family phage terminase large subunit